MAHTSNTVRCGKCLVTLTNKVEQPDTCLTHLVQPSLAMIWGSVVETIKREWTQNIFIYKIIWIVRAFWLVFKCVFIVLWSTKMTWAIWLALSQSCENLQFHERKLSVHMHFVYIVFLFLKTEYDNFIKEVKHVLHAFIAWWKPRWMFGRIREQISENPRCSQRFSPAWEFSQTFASVFTRQWRHREHVLFLN